ncbi:MAG TPA: MBL fold metallo-hydrolase [Candidatus Bathyarchaeia archaeon]|nr:MBL fold metallo-hydrolase [Candidatus Bathyarchaeia archaeon]
MRAVILGSGASWPDPTRSSPSQVIEVNDEPLLIDCGPGTGTNIMRAGFHPTKISRIFLTHLHIDHTLEFPSLVFSSYLAGKNDRTHLYGPPGTVNFSTSLFEKVYPYAPEIIRIIRKEGLDLDVHDTTERLVCHSEKYHVFMARVEHGKDPANAYRIESEEGTVVISGDTRPCKSLAELAEDADLLIHECSFPEDMSEMARITNHSIPSEVGAIANQAGVRKLVLTHLFPLCNGREDEIVKSIKNRFTGEVIVGHDLLEIEL